MINSKFKWNILHKLEVLEEKSAFDILLENRNVHSEEEKNVFFSDEQQFFDPFLFQDMNKVIERIHIAIEKEEKIMIYGDFDVDGVTGTSILYRTLKRIGANVFYYIPNRFTEGYGPNKKAFESFIQQGFSLIITVDNGITGIDEAEFLKDKNIDLIITDHHQPLESIPHAYAILHPHLLTEIYPFKDLSGCGVAFKLAHALLGELPVEYLDLAALGTYADIVSLQSENRAIVKLGIEQLKKTSNIGLVTLTKIASIKTIDEYALGYIYGPRINAPGRMETGNHAVKLLVTEDYDEAYQLANDIENLNNERKAKIDDIIEEATHEIEKNEYDKGHVIIIEKENWHEGVLGIIANRLVDIYNKPVIVLTESDGLYKGSARTLEDFPLFENLDLCSDLLNKFGGHKMAAGLTIKKEKINELRERLHDLAGSNLSNTLNVDCIINPKFVNLNFIKSLEGFRPFGKDNQKPLFLFQDFEIVSLNQMGANNKHLKLQVKKDDVILTAIAFNRGDLFNLLSVQDRVNIVGNLEINEYNNKINIQIMVKDLNCSHKQIYDFRNKNINLSNFENINLQYLYFQDDYGYNNAILYDDNKSDLEENIVLVDLPKSKTELKQIMENQKVSNIFVLFKSDDIFSALHLISRDKMIRLYQQYKKYKQFHINDKSIISELEQLGFNKKIFKLSIQVFFELNFVIIKDNLVKIVEKPEKRNLEESITYKNLQEYIKLKEKLLLSSTIELKQILNKL